MRSRRRWRWSGYTPLACDTPLARYTPLLVARDTPLLPQVVEARVQAFLRLFRGTLLLLDDAEVKAQTESLAAQFTDVDSRLDSQASRLWGECARRRYDFERPWRSADKVKLLTRDKLLAFFDRHLADGSPTRRQLSTHVYSQTIAPAAAELVVEPIGEVFFDPPPDMLVV